MTAESESASLAGRSWRFWRDGRDLVIAQGIPLASSVLITLATASALGTAGRGELALMFTLANSVGILAVCSLHIGVSLAHRAGDSSAVGRGLHLAAYIAVLVLLISVLASPGLTGPFGDVATRGQLQLAGLGASLVVVNLYTLRTVQSLGNNRVFRNGWAIQSVMYLVIGTATAFITESATWVIASWLVGICSSTLYARHHLPSSGSAKDESGWSTMRIVRASLAAHAGLVGLQLLFRLDVVVLGLLATASEVGIYSVAAPIAGLVWVLSEALSLAAFEGDSRRTGHEIEDRRRLLVRLNLIGGVALACALLVAATVLFERLLPGYEEVPKLIAVLSPGVVVQGYARISLSALMAQGRGRESVLIGAVSALLSVLYLPFVQAWQSMGAAYASSIAYCLQAAFVRWRLHRLEVPEEVAVGS